MFAFACICLIGQYRCEREKDYYSALKYGQLFTMLAVALFIV